jgi:hypothetical protein
MILGYILICGMGPLEPNTIEGCRAFTMQFPNVSICEERYELFVAESDKLKEGQYISGHDCLVFGTDL